MALGFIGGSAGSPSTEVELTISCRNLRDMDYLSKSDPMVVVMQQNVLTGSWQQIGRTEVIQNNLNPDFAKKIMLEYHFEQQQLLKFDVYDVDSANLSNLAEHDFIGSVTSSLGQIVASGKISLDLGFSGSIRLGEVLIVAEELAPNKNELTLTASVKNVRRSFMGWFCQNHAYLELHKVDESGEYALVYRTESSGWSSNIKWRPITAPMRTFCGGDPDRNVRVSLYGMKTFSDPHLIGETSFTLSQLISGMVEKDFHLTHPKKTEEIVGTLTLSNYKETEVHTFLDYVMGGMQMHCTIAIDFTASNGDPNSAESLHYVHNNSPNQYEQALRAVVEILQDYDTDKQFPVLGFGARIPPAGNVSHAFYVNMQPDNPFCNGVQGVLSAYHSCIRQIQLYGPTNFTPVINHVTQYARAYQDGSQYFILLIVTDGVITDMLQTKQAIIAASSLPLSIIIVGVGPADFGSMVELDSDDAPLSVYGSAAVRDIVQFVPFRDFQGNHPPVATRLYLAKEVLAEIPAQVVGFMKSKNIKPQKKGTDILASCPRPPEPPPPYEQ